MSVLFKAEDLLVKAEKAVVVVLIFAMVLLSFMQVLLRLFNFGIVWLDPLLKHMVLWAGLTGSALAARYSHHFALEAFVKFAPKAAHRPLELLAAAFTAAASGLLFYASYKFIRDEFMADSVAFYMGDFSVPGGWAELIIPVSFALIGLHTVFGIFRAKPEEPA